MLPLPASSELHFGANYLSNAIQESTSSLNHTGKETPELQRRQEIIDSLYAEIHAQSSANHEPLLTEDPRNAFCWKNVARQKQKEIHQLELELVEMIEVMKRKLDEELGPERETDQESLKSKQMTIQHMNLKLVSAKETASEMHHQATDRLNEIAFLKEENETLLRKQKESHKLFENTSARAKELHKLITSDFDVEKITAPLKDELKEKEKMYASLQVQVEELWKRLEESDNSVVQSEEVALKYREKIEELEAEKRFYEDQVGSEFAVQDSHSRSQPLTPPLQEASDLQEASAELQRAMKAEKTSAEPALEYELEGMAHLQHELSLQDEYAVTRAHADLDYRLEILHSENTQLDLEVLELKNELDIARHREEVLQSELITHRSLREILPPTSFSADYSQFIPEERATSVDDWRKKLRDTENELAIRTAQCESWKGEALLAEKRILSLTDMIRILKQAPTRGHTSVQLSDMPEPTDATSPSALATVRGRALAYEENLQKKTDSEYSKKKRRARRKSNQEKGEKLASGK